MSPLIQSTVNDINITNLTELWEEQTMRCVLLTVPSKQTLLFLMINTTLTFY